MANCGYRFAHPFIIFCPILAILEGMYILKPQSKLHKMNTKWTACLNSLIFIRHSTFLGLAILIFKANKLINDKTLE